MAALATVAVGTTGALIAASPAAAAGATDGTVTGTVFQDFSSSGWYTSGAAAAGVPRNRPVAGVTAIAYDAEGDAVGSAVSASDGTYSIAVNDAYSGDLRVEFSDWPGQYEPAFAAQGAPPPSTLGANDTSVQFVSLAGGTATGVDFGLVIPDQVIQNDAPIATAILYAGDPNRTQGAPNGPQYLSTIVAQPWSATGSSDDPDHFDKRTELANFADVGSVYGLSYNRTKNFLISSAVIKRQSGMGDLGLGGLYQSPDALNADGSVRTGAAMEPWFDLVADLGINLGTVATNSARGLGMPAVPARDTDGFAKSARAGIGGIATSLDGNTLFVTNLADSDVYAIDISQGTTQKPTSYKKVATPVGANQQIWAIMVHSGRLYIGYVDTGTAPGQAASAAGMQAYVRSVPVANAVAGTPGAWREDLTMSLGYDKGSNLTGWGNGQINKGNSPQLYRWNSWTDTWSWTGGSVGFNSSWGWTHAYPQPILAGLAIDIDGYLNLGFLDRTDLQSGNMNWASDPSQPSNRFFESVTGGDTLVASPAAISGQNQTGVCASTGEFRIECDGKVGDRAVRTAAVNDQAPTYNNNQGPATGEFFNDAQNRGEGGIHVEASLGSVLTYPGVDEVAVTAIDPGPGVYRSGIMWFDQRDGTATRYFDQVKGVKDIANPAFEKGGGLGAVALLGVAAPVEIGNRVWLDADLNGRQDPDEPAINGAVVELYTDGGNGQPGAYIGSRTTATINGAPGTYYFRSDDPDLMAPENETPFTTNGSYVLVFRAGDSLTLGGPNAGHPGFAGLTWADLELTTPQADGTTPVNDSNPVRVPDGPVTTGTYALSVGGPGENNHTYDAGYYGTNTYLLQKAFNPGDVELAPDTSYTFNVVAAENFRGQNRLSGAASDPVVSEVTFSVDADGAWTWDSSQALPFGYTLTLEEDGGASNVTWNPANPDDATQGVVVITPAGGQQARATVQATNNFGKVTVTKTVTGDGADRVGSDVLFKIQYQIGDGDVLDAWVSEDAPFAVSTSAMLPGTSVKVREVTPITTDPAVVGVEWGTPAWTLPDGASGPDEDGWVTITVPGADVRDKNVTLGLANTANEVKGGLAITKARAAGEPLPDQTFSFEYRVGADGSAQTLGPIPAGETVMSPATIPYGSTVFIREIAPVDQPSVIWADPVWTGLPAGTTGPDADGWYSFTFTPETAGALLKLTATNKATELFGQFDIAKTVATTGNPNVAGKEFTIQYRLGTGDPVAFGEWSDLTLEAGETSATIGDLRFGTVVQVREVQPADTPGVSWGAPAWTVNGEPAVIVDGAAQFTINGTDKVAFAVTNHATETFGSFTLAKALDGTGAPLVADVTYPVEVQIGDGEVEEIGLTVGTVWDGPTDLPIGTVVKVREVTPLPAVDGVEWGPITWAASDGTVLTTDEEGWTVFTITSDEAAAALTVTNRPTQLFGGFTVQKILTIGAGDPQVPDSYTVEYVLDDGAVQTITLTAGQTSALIGGLPYGTDVKVREVAPAPVDGVVWETSWTIDGEVATPDESGWVGFEVSSQTTVKFVVTNKATQLFGKFQVAKTVTGDGEDLVPDDAEFTFHYVLGDGEPQEITATRAQASEIIGGLAYGTVVTITEVDFPQIPGIEFAGAPVWSIDGVVIEGDEVTFTIDGETLVAVGADNTATRIYGTFDLTKELVGAIDRIPDDASFTVEYSVDGQETWTALDALTKEHLTVTGPQLLVDTEVWLREVTPTDGVDYAWKDPVFSLGGEPVGDTVSFVIAEKDQVVKVGLVNEAIPVNGQFSVLKKVVGDGRGLLIGAPVFTVEYTAEGSDTVGKLLVRNGETATSDPLPAGTKVTVREILPSGALPSGASWGTPVFVLADGTRVERGATFTITADTTLALTLENPVTPPKPPMPPTGVSGLGLGAIGAGLLLLGGIVVFLARRRRDA